MQEAQPEKQELHKVIGGLPLKPTAQVEQVTKLLTGLVQTLQAILQG